VTDSVPRRRWTFRRFSLMTALAVVAGIAVPLLVIHEPAAAAPLRQHATARGKFFGYAANAALLCNNSATCTSGQDATYRNIGQTEFNQITPENSMKWQITEPTDNNFQFAEGDGIVANATANGQTVHGHTLLWHQQTPGYVTSITNAATLRTVTNDHIAQVVGRWAGNATVTGWDVVNEAFNEDGSRRGNVWQNVIGNGYIAEAFTAARAADSNAQLCYNDFNIEGINNKSTAVFNMVSQFRQQGVPIDCVGMQAHFVLNGIPGNFQQNIQRFADLGLTVRISELDIRIPSPTTDTKLAQQATNYASVVNTCLAIARCAGITVWGIDDGHSWLPNECCPEIDPLLFARNTYAQKPAYTSVHNALDNGTGDTTPPSTPGMPTASNVGTTTATLNWTASTDTGGSGLAGYNVHREQGATDPILATPTTNTVNLTNLTPNTQYQIYIRARDNAGNLSAASGLVTFMTGQVNDTVPPSTPGTPTASNVGSTTATLNWAASTDTGGSGLAGYNVYREQGATDPILATPTTNSANLTNLTANTSYQVYIRARDNAGNLSNPSATTTFMTTGGGTGGCSVTPTLQTQWPTGYVFEPTTVRNTGSTTITTWTVTFTLPAGHTIVGSWNGIFTINGQNVTVRPVSHNATLAPNGTGTFGFQVSRPDGNTALANTFACTSP